MNHGFFDNLEKQKNIYLTTQQQEAVLHRDGPALVLAVPGAGKTTVLITRAAFLIHDKKAKPHEILSLTFSRSAAKDMEKRFEELYGESLNKKPKFSTIHSFAFQVLTKEFNSKGIEYHFIEGKEPVIHKMEMLKQLYYKYNKNSLKEEGLEELSNAISFVKNRMMKAAEIEQYPVDIKNFKDIYLQYEQWKKSNRYIDFDDMLTLAYGILRNNKALCNSYRERYPYIQVDEGQDTSRIQYALIRILAYPWENLFIVADDDQSIYGFRGADPKELIDFKNTYPKGKIFYMEENFRSTQSIVQTADKFIKGNQIRFHKNLYTQREGGKPITIVKSNHYSEQLDYLVEEIKSKDNQGSTAILFRNHLSTIPLIDRLEHEKISFNMRESKKYFLHHWLTRDVISFIHLALDHNDIKSFEHIYYKMNQYISKKDLEFIKKDHSAQTVFEKLQNMRDLRTFQKNRMIQLEDKFFALQTLPPVKALEYIQNTLSYNDFLKERERTRSGKASVAEFILQRLKSIAKNTSTLVGFLYRLEELEEGGRLSYKGTSNLYLSTLHGAKGLEFDRVYLIDLVEEQIPTLSSIKDWDKGNIGLLEEERRLFYVGMTRAKEELTLMAIQSSNPQGQETSRFIEEVKTCFKNKYKENDKESYFQPRDRVSHKKFGKGKIKWIKENTIAIDFDNHGVKKLAAEYCMHKGILEKLR